MHEDFVGLIYGSHTHLSVLAASRNFDTKEGTFKHIRRYGVWNVLENIVFNFRPNTPCIIWNNAISLGLVQWRKGRIPLHCIYQIWCPIVYEYTVWLESIGKRGIRNPESPQTCIYGLKAVNTLISNPLRNAAKTIVTFADLVKAFDTSNHALLISILGKYGAPPRLWSAKKRM